MLTVIETFRDLEDGHLYHAGDVFPYDGRVVPRMRIDLLKSPKNLACKALLVETEDIPTKTEKPRQRAKKRGQAAS